MTKIIMAVFLAIALGGLPVCAAEPPAAANVINAADLYGKDVDEVRQAHGNGPITVTGIANYVGPDTFGLPAIELSDVKGGTTYVLAVLPFGDFFKLGDVPEGSEVTVSGDPRGATREGLFILKQCVILTE